MYLTAPFNPTVSLSLAEYKGLLCDGKAQYDLNLNPASLNIDL
jgi:hypothetical protein